MKPASPSGVTDLPLRGPNKHMTHNIEKSDVQVGPACMETQSASREMTKNVSFSPYF